MDRQLLRIFQSELALQCQFVLLGAANLNAALVGEISHMRVWLALQEILVAAANISKLLWGSRTGRETERMKREATRQPLRESVGISDDSCLRSPALRNDFEHFDERIEAWVKKDPQRIYIGRSIGPPQSIVIEGGIPEQRFGNFDPSTAMATFWDTEASIQDIVTEVQQIFPILQRELQRPPWTEAD